MTQHNKWICLLNKTNWIKLSVWELSCVKPDCKYWCVPALRSLFYTLCYCVLSAIAQKMSVFNGYMWIWMIVTPSNKVKMVKLNLFSILLFTRYNTVWCLNIKDIVCKMDYAKRVHTMMINILHQIFKLIKLLPV